MITITITKHGAAHIIALKGRLDAATSPEFEKKLIELGADKGPVVLNFQDLEYVSSAGLRVLITLSQSGRKVVLCSMPELVAEVFDISGLSSVFMVHADQAAALKAIAG